MLQNSKSASNKSDSLLAKDHPSIIKFCMDKWHPSAGYEILHKPVADVKLMAWCGIDVSLLQNPNFVQTLKI